MTQITKVDKNFANQNVSEDGLRWMDIHNPDINIYGTPNRQKKFTRIDESVSHLFSDSLQLLSQMTSGVRIKFCTNSPVVALRATLKFNDKLPHMASTGVSGFDLYVKEKEEYIFKHVFKPGEESLVEGQYWTEDQGDKQILINFPLYDGVTQLEIGIAGGCDIKCSEPYKIEKPILFYGSSITQGGCASRPGNAYPLMISRWMDVDIINLGFSGNAKGEEAMARHIAGIETSAVVIDYDHNAPTIEHLEKTHSRFFEIIRKANKDLPILIISKPDFESNRDENRERRKVIYKTYLDAKKAGDQNVYFIDGECLFGEEERDSCTVDGCHPNDLGFMRMAKTIFQVIKTLL